MSPDTGTVERLFFLAAEIFSQKNVVAWAQMFSRIFCTLKLIDLIQLKFVFLKSEIYNLEKRYKQKASSKKAEAAKSDFSRSGQFTVSETFLYPLTARYSS